MQTFSMFFSEDAGDKFSKMSDDQFIDWKKKNPGASDKADELRKKAQTKDAAPKVKELPTSALAKKDEPVSFDAKPGYKEALKNAALKRAKELASSQAKKAGSALLKTGKDKIADATRKSEMGKWSQGAKTAPSGSALTKTKPESDGALVPTTQKSASGSAGAPELKGQQAKDAKEKEEAGTYRKMRDAVRGGLQDVEDAKSAKEADTNKKKGGFVSGVKKSLGGDLISKDDETRRSARNELGQKAGKTVKDTPGAIAKFIARNMRSSVNGSGGPDFGSQQQGLRQR